MLLFHSPLSYLFAFSEGNVKVIAAVRAAEPPPAIVAVRLAVEDFQIGVPRALAILSWRAEFELQEVHAQLANAGLHVDGFEGALRGLGRVRPITWALKGEM